MATPWQTLDDGLGAQELAWRERIELRLYQIACRAGTTDDPEIYQTCYRDFFDELDAIDHLLGERRFALGGTQASIVDGWLSALLIRFEVVFYSLYKLNRQRLEEFANLAHYLRDVRVAVPVPGTETIDAIRRRYYLADNKINPLGRVPVGAPALSLPHDRELRFGRAKQLSDRDEDPHAQRLQGEWVRPQSEHRTATVDGERFRPEAGRYHLYIANNCPWSHRTALVRSLKGLEDVVSMDVLFYTRDPENGWQFRAEEPGCSADTLHNSRFIGDLYKRAGSTEKSVPLLWDRKTDSIVSNESAEIMRLFDVDFGTYADSTWVLYPDHLAEQIDRLNVFIYHAVNNGAYKAGFAESQEAYEDAYRRFFEALEYIDHMLRGRRFLLGDELTESDVRLFPTIFRFDAVYYTRFNLNQRMVRDIPSLSRWLHTMLEIPAVRRSSDLTHCRKGYFGRTGNNIVPLGPLTLEP